MCALVSFFENAGDEPAATPQITAQPASACVPNTTISVPSYTIKNAVVWAGNPVRQQDAHARSCVRTLCAGTDAGCMLLLLLLLLLLHSPWRKLAVACVL